MALKYISASAIAGILVLALAAGAWVWFIKPTADTITANEGQRLANSAEDTRDSALKLGQSFRQVIPMPDRIAQRAPEGPAAARATTSGQTPSGSPPSPNPVQDQYQAGRDAARQFFQGPGQSGANPGAANPANPAANPAAAPAAPIAPGTNPAGPTAGANPAAANPGGSPAGSAAAAAAQEPADDPLRHRTEAGKDAYALQKELEGESGYSSRFVQEVRILEVQWQDRYNAAMDAHDEFKARVADVDQRAKEYFSSQLQLRNELHSYELRQQRDRRLANEQKIYSEWRSQVARTQATAERIRRELEDLNNEFISLGLSAAFQQFTQQHIELPASMLTLQNDINMFEQQHAKLKAEFLPDPR